jgi:hypothetical protein
MVIELPTDVDGDALRSEVERRVIDLLGGWMALWPCSHWCSGADVASLDVMRTFRPGQLVTLVEEPEALEGIVVDAPSLVKIEVAVPDEGHGAVFRTVHPKLLKERAEEGEHDEALRRLIRRNGSAGRGPRSGPGSGRRGHSQATGHRTTGK